MWEVELEPEVQEWLGLLPPSAFATVTFHLGRLVEHGAMLRMPHSRALGNGLFELRFNLGRVAWRITFFFPTARTIVLLMVFRKQRQGERIEVARGIR